MRDYRLVEDTTLCPPWCLSLNTTGLWVVLKIHKSITLQTVPVCKKIVCYKVVIVHATYMYNTVQISTIPRNGMSVPIKCFLLLVFFTAIRSFVCSFVRSFVCSFIQSLCIEFYNLINILFLRSYICTWYWNVYTQKWMGCQTLGKKRSLPLPSTFHQADSL